MTIYFYNFQNSLENRKQLSKNHRAFDDKTVFIFRQDGWKQNRFLIALAKEKGVENVYTDDETMLHYAQWDEEHKCFKVMIMDEKSNPDFVPLSVRHPNLRYVNNLVTMQQKGLFDYDPEINNQ